MTELQPLVLLDFDGVVNALGTENQAERVWSDWSRSYFDGRRVQVAYGVRRFLISLRSRGIEVRWVTELGEFVHWVEPDFGIPAFHVSPVNIPHSGGWWKSSTVEQELAGPQRRIIWIDDQIEVMSSRDRLTRKLVNRSRDCSNFLTVNTRPATGLRWSDIGAIEEFLRGGAEQEFFDEVMPERMPERQYNVTVNVPVTGYWTNTTAGLGTNTSTAATWRTW